MGLDVNHIMSNYGKKVNKFFPKVKCDFLISVIF